LATDPLSPVFYVYMLRRPDRDDPLEPGRAAPFYIGKGSNGRIKVHRRNALNYLKGKPVRYPIKNNTIVYLWGIGLDYEIEVIKEGLTQKEANEIEKEMILNYGKKFNKTGILTNITDGGEGISGIKRIFTAEHKAKIKSGRKLQISSGMKGRRHTDETKARISSARKGAPAWNKGVPADPGAIKKVHDAWVGNKQTPEALAKISEAGKQHWADPAYKAKMRATMKKVQETPEYREKLSKAVKKVWAKRKGLLVEQHG